MEVNVEETSELTRKITVTLPEEDVQPKLNKAYDKLKRESKMKGFRRGKVPRSIIVKQFKPQVEAETSEKLVQDNYFNIIEKEVGFYRGIETGIIMCKSLRDMFNS